MDKAKVIHAIGISRVISVIRTCSAEDARTVIAAVTRGGCKLVEVTLTIPGAVDLIREITERSPDVIVGAGTVSSAEQAKACVAAGAQFIVSPWIDPEVISFCTSASVLVMSGALTPTEVRNAMALGADVVKIFPIESMGGVSHIRALKSVLPDSILVPTGGVTVDDAADFIRAGAFAVGIGSDLVKINELNSGDDATVISRISGLVTGLKELNSAASPTY